jgi:hypothetical protein
MFEPKNGFPSVFEACVLTDDFIPAVEAAVPAGVTFMAAVGGRGSSRVYKVFSYA